jgi:UPF0755 protein
VVATFLAVALVAAAIAGFAISGRLQQPYKGYAEAERFVDVPPGTPIVAIGDRLAAAGVVRDRWMFRLAYWLEGRGRSLQAGEYRFDQPVTTFDVIEKLARGDVYLRSITFPEGLTLAEMAGLYEREGLGPGAAFLDAARDPAPIRALDPAAPDLEGYLFPDTYRLPRSGAAADLVRQMVRRFEESFDEDLRRAATDRGFDVRQAVALAALVEKETALAAERPLVAAVYWNRLEIGMGLQCDPTVIYALTRAGRYTGNLTREDLAFDSPYNTYRYAGLPPGPIAAPGRASLEAAVRPADVPYLYFVSRNDGSHVFATTLDEHNRNVWEYQVKYFRDQRRRNGTGR